MKQKYLLILLIILNFPLFGQENEEFSVVLRVMSEYPTKTYGSVCYNGSTLCFLDEKGNSFSPIDVEKGKACVRIQDKIRYLPSPAVGETIFFLKNNQKVGVGVIDSLVLCEVSGGHEIFYSLLEGETADIFISKTLFVPFSQEVVIKCQDIKNSKILEAVINKLKEKGISTHSLEDWKIIKKIPFLISNKEIGWLVSIEAQIKLPADYKLDSSEEIFKEELFYSINAIIKQDSILTVEFITACLPRNIIFSRQLLNYCWDNSLYTLTLEDEKLIFDYQDFHIFCVEYGPFNDWVDIDGDGSGEVIISEHYYEGYGLSLLKRKNNKWVAIARYSAGI